MLSPYLGGLASATRTCCPAPLPSALAARPLSSSGSPYSPRAVVPPKPLSHFPSLAGFASSPWNANPVGTETDPLAPTCPRALDTARPVGAITPGSAYVASAQGTASKLILVVNFTPCWGWLLLLEIPVGKETSSNTSPQIASF